MRKTVIKFLSWENSIKQILPRTLKEKERLINTKMQSNLKQKKRL